MFLLMKHVASLMTLWRALLMDKGVNNIILGLSMKHLISEIFHYFENNELLLRMSHNEFGCWVHVQSSLRTRDFTQRQLTQCKHSLHSFEVMEISCPVSPHCFLLSRLYINTSRVSAVGNFLQTWNYGKSMSKRRQINAFLFANIHVWWSQSVVLSNICAMWLRGGDVDYFFLCNSIHFHNRHSLFWKTYRKQTILKKLPKILRALNVKMKVLNRIGRNHK